MNLFKIEETADGEFILRVQGGYVHRCFSYDDAIRAYEDYLMMRESRKQHCK